jgi:hypothetical protein
MAKIVMELVYSYDGYIIDICFPAPGTIKHKSEGSNDFVQVIDGKIVAEIPASNLRFGETYD